MRSVDLTVRAPAQVADPLQRLGADELRLATTLLAGHGLVGEHTRFAYLGLEEPPKAEVPAFREGTRPPCSASLPARPSPGPSRPPSASPP